MTPDRSAVPSRVYGRRGIVSLRRQLPGPEAPNPDPQGMISTYRPFLFAPGICFHASDRYNAALTGCSLLQIALSASCGPPSPSRFSPAMGSLAELKLPPAVSLLAFLANFSHAILDCCVTFTSRSQKDTKYKNRVFSALPVQFDILSYCEPLCSCTASFVLLLLGFSLEIHWPVLVPGIWHNLCVARRLCVRMLRVERNATDSYTAHLRRILPIALPALISFATAGNFAAAGVLGVWSFELPSKLLILIPCVSTPDAAELVSRSRRPASALSGIVGSLVRKLGPHSLVHYLLALAAQRVASNDIDWAVFWLRLRRRVAASRTGQESIYSVEDATRYPRNAHTDAVATDKPGSHIHVDVVGPEKDRQAVLQRLTGKHSSIRSKDTMFQYQAPTAY
ncbi:hypothetical protein PGQ11_007965 [Apiospora arundinis]|uniref:Uncharacterized protein n=1 Tax=Apiospora arundinis TaxID=335852 RepID=A0ABR2IX33_9PEZI